MDAQIPVSYIADGHYFLNHADASPPGLYETTDDKLLYPAPEDHEGMRTL